MEHEGQAEYVFVAESWQSALDLAESALSELRDIFPAHTWFITETGARTIDEAMTRIKDGIVALHRAGPHVLGREQYEQWAGERSMNSITRGE